MQLLIFRCNQIMKSSICMCAYPLILNFIILHNIVLSTLGWKNGWLVIAGRTVQIHRSYRSKKEFIRQRLYTYNFQIATDRVKSNTFIDDLVSGSAYSAYQPYDIVSSHQWPYTKARVTRLERRIHNFRRYQTTDRLLVKPS